MPLIPAASTCLETSAYGSSPHDAKALSNNARSTKRTTCECSPPPHAQLRWGPSAPGCPPALKPPSFP
eukprot:6191046-Pleurochrysis_carterae.AAC.1